MPKAEVWTRKKFTTSFMTLPAAMNQMGRLYDEDLTTYKIIDDNEVVLEVKFNEILPEQIAIVLSTVPMIRQAFSKFAMCRSIK